MASDSRRAIRIWPLTLMAPVREFGRIPATDGYSGSAYVTPGHRCWHALLAEDRVLAARLATVNVVLWFENHSYRGCEPDGYALDVERAVRFGRGHDQWLTQPPLHGSVEGTEATVMIRQTLIHAHSHVVFVGKCGWPAKVYVRQISVPHNLDVNFLSVVYCVYADSRVT
ncbi:hypothetical protein EEB13_30850 [Rhodococcus sp. WS3]|nr:hypothetical protein EEB13_30850 [Rhodococcus sp. WS3]